MSTVEQMQRTLDMPTAPLDETSFPTAVDIHGRPLDPSTILHVRLPRFGEPAAQDSIFDVPGGRNERLHKVTVQEQLEFLYQAGFRGRVIVKIDSGPHPGIGEKDEKASFRINKYPKTECQICTALIAGKERMLGYKLLEFRHAAQFGCQTCHTLYSGITHFASVLDLDYEDWESGVDQKSVQELRLLSETISVTTSFMKDGEGVAGLEFTCTGWDRNSAAQNIVNALILDTSSYAAVKLVRGWMQDCLSNHPECNTGGEILLPTRLLDVSKHRVKLVYTEGQEGCYLALSHCWGPKPVVRTLIANIEDMMVDIPWVSLSKTFQDAIIFTWKLGYKYIWIDSLCIVQDDKGDWETQASRMAQIFSNAELTISATHARDGDGGCFSVRSQEPFKFNHRGHAEQRIHKDIWGVYQSTTRDRDGVIKNISMRIKSQHGLKESPLLQRAWVFQEQILSPRIIHFASGELYWECQSYVCSESTGWEKRSDTLAEETHRRKAYQQLVQRKLSLQRPFPESQEQERRRDFDAYRSLVEQYTSSHITMTLDRLPALSGITFGRRDEYLGGMWRSILVESLHWISTRTESHAMAYRLAEYTYRAPSWSWAAVESPIQHIGPYSSHSFGKGETVATVLSAGCTPEGVDARGRIVEGYLKIQGPTVPCRIGSIGIVEEPGYHDSDSYAKLTTPYLEGTCNLDIPVVFAQATPGEVRVGEEMLLLRISDSVALVLRGMEDIPGAYQRIGIFWMQEDAEDWFVECSHSSLFIL